MKMRTKTKRSSRKWSLQNALINQHFGFPCGLVSMVTSHPVRNKHQDGMKVIL